MKHRHLAIVILGVLLCSWANAAEPYEATAQDVDLKTLVERWAKIDGKELVWQTGWNSAIKDAAGLNAFAKLSYAKTFQEAFTSLNQELEHASNDEGRARPHRPLRACQFDNAIVIRSIEQANCSEPF